MIEGIPIAGLTAPTLIGILVLMLFTGKLWTKAAYDEKVKEAAQWREAYEKSEESRRTSDGQTAELLELAKTTHSFMTAVFYNSERIRQSGEPDAVSSKTT